jgi:UDP-N-acetylglucosamine 3-dehydrogenase
MTRVAVIGVGSMGMNHARVYSELADVELVGVADENRDRAELVAEKFGTKAFSNYRILLDKARPEAVSITVPTSLHEKVATEALQAGSHVLVEKPITAKLEEGERLIELANQLGRQLMVGHIIRFNPAIQELKKQLLAGKAERIIQIFCRRAGPFPARIRDVGVVVDLAPHDIDVMRFLTGLEPTRVFAETTQHIHTEHEDLLFAVMHFPEDITAALEINWLTPTKMREVLVLGERGLFRVDDLLQDLYFYENSQANVELYSSLRTIKGVSEGSMTRFALQRVEPLHAELDAFLSAIRNNKRVPVTGEDGLKALRLALALVESGRTHQVVEV